MRSGTIALPVPKCGVLAHRAGPLERAAARICREAGARVATSVALQDLNPDVPPTDGRRIEVVANGLPLWQGAQIAVDTTLVSPLQRDGQPRPGADARPGLALAQAAARKRRTYPELQPGGRGRCRLVQRRSVGAAPTAREGSRSRAGPVGPGSRKSSASPKVDGPRGARSHAGARAIAPGVAGPAGRRQRRGELLVERP